MTVTLTRMPPSEAFVDWLTEFIIHHCRVFSRAPFGEPPAQAIGGGSDPGSKNLWVLGGILRSYFCVETTSHNQKVSTGYFAFE